VMEDGCRCCCSAATTMATTKARWHCSSSAEAARPSIFSPPSC
jgi:hypothetical protein